MGYRVVYGPEKTEDLPTASQGNGRRWLCGVFFALFLWMTVSFWPRGSDFLGRLVFSGDPAVTAAALESLALELQAGAPMGEALEAFCQEIVLHGSQSQG